MVARDTMFYNTGYQEYLPPNFANSVISLKDRLDQICGDSSGFWLILSHLLYKEHVLSWVLKLVEIWLFTGSLVIRQF